MAKTVKKAKKVKTPKRRRRAMMAAPPALAVAISKEIERLYRVVGVFWGARRSKGHWYREPCLSVHVKTKRPHSEFDWDQPLPDTLARLRELDKSRARKRPFPKQIDGLRIDVLEVGTPKHHSLSVTGRLDGGSLGISTPTVVARDDEDTYALVSGHGALKASRVELGGFSGDVLGGDFGGGASVDWALVRFEGAGADADTDHPAAHKRAPVPLGKGVFGGDRLSQFSGERGQRVPGVLIGVATTTINFKGAVYSSLLSIARLEGGPPFSVEGDSGSLIVDQDGRAVAAVVGGDVEKGAFYAYDLRALSAGQMSAKDLARFFKDT